MEYGEKGTCLNRDNAFKTFTEGVKRTPITIQLLSIIEKIRNQQSFRALLPPKDSFEQLEISEDQIKAAFKTFTEMLDKGESVEDQLLQWIAEYMTLDYRMIARGNSERGMMLLKKAYQIVSATTDATPASTEEE